MLKLDGKWPMADHYFSIVQMFLYSKVKGFIIDYRDYV